MLKDGAFAFMQSDFIGQSQKDNIQLAKCIQTDRPQRSCQKISICSIYFLQYERVLLKKRGGIFS